MDRPLHAVHAALRAPVTAGTRAWSCSRRQGREHGSFQASRPKPWVRVPAGALHHDLEDAIRLLEVVRIVVDGREHGSHASTPNGDRKGGLQKQGAGETTDNELGQVAVITGGDNDVFEDAVRAPSALSESDQASEESDPGSEVSIEVEELTISGKTYLLDRTSGDVYEESSSESPRIIGKWDGRRIVRDDISGANTPAQDGEDSDESTLSVEVQEMEFDGNVYLVDIAAGIVYEDRDEPCAVGSFKNNRIVLHD